MSETRIPDFSAPQASSGGSPKGLYLQYLLQQCAKHQWIMATSKEEEGYFNIQNSCLSLISWCPDSNKRNELFNTYKAKVKEYDGDVPSASLFTVGKLVDYLNDVLEFTEKAYGDII